MGGGIDGYTVDGLRLLLLVEGHFGERRAGPHYLGSTYSESTRALVGPGSTH